MTDSTTTLVVLVVAAALAGALWHWVLFAARIEVLGGSGRRLVLVRRVRTPAQVHRRDLLLVRSVEAGRVLLRQAVGLPGDRVRLDDFGGLTVEDAAGPVSWPRSAGGADLVCTVPAGELLLLGEPVDGAGDLGRPVAITGHRTWKQPGVLPGAVLGRVILPRP